MGQTLGYIEYGGVGPLWEAVTEEGVVAEQVPRLYQLVRDALPMKM